MGELQHEAFQFTFNGFLKVAFPGSRVTSDAGLILVGEWDERLGLETLIAAHLSDSRQGVNTQFSLADLLRQSVYSRLAGYEDVNDAVRVTADPTFRLIGSPKRWDRGAALTSTLHWFETDLLTREENLVGLMAVNREVLAQAGMPTRAARIVLDMDSSESPVHGTQEGSAYNGHFESVCDHPLFLFNEHGDCLAATLRPGNVHSAEDWDDLLVPEIERQQAEGKRVAFRAAAAFAKPEIYDALEQREQPEQSAGDGPKAAPSAAGQHPRAAACRGTRARAQENGCHLRRSQLAERRLRGTRQEPRNGPQEDCLGRPRTRRRRRSSMEAIGCQLRVWLQGPTGCPRRVIESLRVPDREDWRSRVGRVRHRPRRALEPGRCLLQQDEIGGIDWKRETNPMNERAHRILRTLQSADHIRRTLVQQVCRYDQMFSGGPRPTRPGHQADDRAGRTGRPTPPEPRRPRPRPRDHRRGSDHGSAD